MKLGIDVQNHENLMLLITFLTQRKTFDQVLVNFLSEIS